MDILKIKLGYYTSILVLLSISTFAICFFALFSINPVFEWTSLEAYVAYNQTYDQSLRYAAQASMIVLAICLLVLIALLDDRVEQEYKFFSKLSLHFMGICTTLLCIGYFLQLTTVRWNYENSTLDGLEHFIQFYPNSAVLAIIMSGYTLFLGLASFRLLPLLQNTPNMKLLRWGFWINGLSCMLGLIGFVFQILPLILYATNIGNGIGLSLLGIGFLSFFNRIEK